ncbi:hypothetical protein Hanom_Chr02g00116821 [Helianthus anomalus]
MPVEKPITAPFLHSKQLLFYYFANQNVQFMSKIVVTSFDFVVIVATSFVVNTRISHTLQ